MVKYVIDSEKIITIELVPQAKPSPTKKPSPTISPSPTHVVGYPKCVIVDIYVSSNVLPYGSMAYMEVSLENESNISGKCFLDIINKSPIDVVVEYRGEKHIAHAYGRNIIRFLFTMKPKQIIKMPLHVYPIWSEVHEKEKLILELESGHVV